MVHLREFEILYGSIAAFRDLDYSCQLGWFTFFRRLMPKPNSLAVEARENICKTQHGYCQLQLHGVDEFGGNRKIKSPGFDLNM